MKETEVLVVVTSNVMSSMIYDSESYTISYIDRVRLHATRLYKDLLHYYNIVRDEEHSICSYLK